MREFTRQAWLRDQGGEASVLRRFLALTAMLDAMLARETVDPRPGLESDLLGMRRRGGFQVGAVATGPIHRQAAIGAIFIADPTGFGAGELMG